MASAQVPMPLSTTSPSSLPNSLDPPTPTSYDYQIPLSSKSDTLPSFLLSLQEPEMAQHQDLPVRISVPGPGLQHARRNSKARQGPPPLPDFKFDPGAELKSDVTPSPTHPILEEMASNTRNAKGGKPALPAFSFNPSTVGDMPVSGSPTKSGFGEVRASGHRRRESGYVGGDMTSMTSSSSSSSSPVKNEGFVPAGPAVSAMGPPSGRRHTHRRSEAVSISDQEKSAIIKENAMSKHRAGSAPSTPADSKQFFDSDSSPPATAASFSAYAGETPPASPSRRQSTPTHSRARVEFSDSVRTYRPRPLSHISSETEDSTSTIRYSHSLSGSINSLAAISPATMSVSLSPTDESPRPRPRTADAATLGGRFIDKKTGNSQPEGPLFRHVASKSLTPPKQESPCEEKEQFWPGNGSPGKVSPMTTPTVQGVNTSTQPTNPFRFTPGEESPRPRTSPERSASIKKRKVKTWTRGIFSQKTKKRPMKNAGRRTPTPPLNRRIPDSVFDNDDTVIISDAPSPILQNIARPPLQTNSAPIVPTLSDHVDDGGADLTIDLDVALGTPQSEEQQPQTGFAAARARLHSGGLRSTSDPFGNLHRRAESAPHLPFPNRNIFGVHRIGSNSSMGVEEVFDEGEEDDYLAGSGSEQAASPIIKAMDHGAPLESSSTTLGVQASEPTGHTKEDSTSVEETSVKTTSHLQTSSSNLAHGHTSDPIGRRPASVPIDFAFKSSNLPHVPSEGEQSAPQSAVSSEAGHGNFDLHFGHSRYLNEPGQTVSTDDVPSLTDSVSTATGAQARVSGSVYTRPSLEHREQRSLSEAVPVTESLVRASKRASLVSLTRLIPGSSHGEKSKLRFGESAANTEGEEAKPAKKANRISRLMNYLRPKEKQIKQGHK